MNNYAPSTDSTVASVDVSMASTSLLTNMYELTMLQGVLAPGAASRHSVFELFSRRLPGSRRLSIMAGTGRLLDAVEVFILTPVQVSFLHRTGVVNDETLDFLRDYRLSRTARDYVEDRCYFVGSPLLTVEGTFVGVYILEILALSIYNYDCAAAVAAPRTTIATYGRPCVDFRARQAHKQAAVTAAKASVVDGFVGMSSLEAKFLYGIPTVGILAHSFTLLHGTEEEALVAQVASLGPSATILVDIYDIVTGMERVVRTARAADDEFGVVYLDSGGLVTKAFKVRAQPDALGAISTGTTVTNNLDEYAIAALGVAPMDSCGMGIRLIAGSGRPTVVFVYKLVEREGVDGTIEEVVKFSSGGKSTVGGRKWAGHILNSEGTAAEEPVVASSSQDEGMSTLSQADARPLQMLLVDEGRIIKEHCGEEASSTAAERYRASYVELSCDAWRLSDGESALSIRHVDPDGQGVTRR